MKPLCTLGAQQGHFTDRKPHQHHRAWHLELPASGNTTPLLLDVYFNELPGGLVDRWSK